MLHLTILTFSYLIMVFIVITNTNLIKERKINDSAQIYNIFHDFKVNLGYIGFPL